MTFACILKFHSLLFFHEMSQKERTKVNYERDYNLFVKQPTVLKSDFAA